MRVCVFCQQLSWTIINTLLCHCVSRARKFTFQFVNARFLHWRLEGSRENKRLFFNSSSLPYTFCLFVTLVFIPKTDDVHFRRHQFPARHFLCYLWRRSSPRADGAVRWSSASGHVIFQSCGRRGFLCKWRRDWCETAISSHSDDKGLNMKEVNENIGARFPQTRTGRLRWLGWEFTLTFTKWKPFPFEFPSWSRQWCK